MGESTDVVEGLRERKKRLTRQLISDTATAMFLDRGFDAVRVADVAAACGVSEKTVYNYFPSKESLLLDREPEMIAVVRHAFGADAPPGSPVEVFVSEIATDVEAMVRSWSELPPSVSPAEVLRGFRELIDSTPSLRAAQRDMMDRITQVAAEELAARAGMDPSDPEPQIAATAICGLWGVMYRALERHVPDDHDAARAHETAAAIVDEVRRASRLVETGLWAFGLEVQGTPSSRQFEQAAHAANDARLQVIEAVRAAKAAWRELAEQARLFHDDEPGHARGGPGRPRREEAGAGGGPWGRGGPNRRGQTRGGPNRGGRNSGERSGATFDGLDPDALRTAREEMRKAKRDLIDAKRRMQQASKQQRRGGPPRRSPGK